VKPGFKRVERHGGAAPRTTMQEQERQMKARYRSRRPSKGVSWWWWIDPAKSMSTTQIYAFLFILSLSPPDRTRLAAG
jgi:hypothetical protein